LITYGALLLHDSRVSENDNNTFLDLLEDYFNQPESDLKKDERPELGYQVGVTLENTEKPKCAVDEPCLRIIERLDPTERPLDITAHAPDPKCRFFWKMSEKPPYVTNYPALNAPNVVPHAGTLRSRWPATMEAWGNAMKNAYADPPSGYQSLLPTIYILGLRILQKWPLLGSDYRRTLFEKPVDTGMSALY
jgi:hypothetical protein